MTENQTQIELSGLERFSHLEDKIFRVVEAFKAIQKQNETLQAENRTLKEEVEVFKKNDASQKEILVDLQKERESLRDRVEKALSLLATLEVR